MHKLDTQRPYVVDLLRIFLGIGLLAKGIMLLQDQAQARAFLALEHISVLPFLFAHYAIMALIVGGFLMTIGLITRAAALAQMPVFIGAVVYHYKIAGLFSGALSLEFAVLVTLLLGMFTIYGSGPLSLDQMFRRPKGSSRS